MSEYPEVEIIACLMALAARYGLQELEVEEAGLTVTLRVPEPLALGSEEPAANGGSAYLWRPPIWSETRSQPAVSTRPETAQPLLAPLTGTFYHFPAPDAPPFVEVGDTVEEGQVIGLIEAMKVFSEIAADRAGVVVEIVAPNGRIVQHGDVLLYIDPGSL